ncbi:hypothetical protein PEM37_35565 [Streptomyces sp. AD681]|uniref:hypothetical protein n=1 Tax=Streptomyces sp. AD681 TaxID=3019069 RepID=UPI0022F1563C|nr:hypothetical protein [Streptomyces sp. AD681]MDA5146837.1 hypothetical protein [Streptomyces sp. AD681]
MRQDYRDRRGRGNLALGQGAVRSVRNARTACTADRASGAVSVVGPKKGVVTRTVATNAGVPNPAADERSGVLVVNRTGATGTPVDPRRGAAEDTVTRIRLAR